MIKEYFGQAVNAAESSVSKAWHSVFPSHEERVAKAEALEKSICESMGIEYQAPSDEAEIV